MANENIWLGVKALAASLNGSREHGEHMLDALEQDLKALTEQQRIEAREEMTVIVAQLARLEMRVAQK